MNEIRNAKITGTSLGFEGHGIMTCFLFLEWDGGGVGFGGYALENKDGITFIKATLGVVGVETWEELKGKYVRVEVGFGCRPSTGIGNLIKDEWLYPQEFFNECEGYE